MVKNSTLFFVALSSIFLIFSGGNSSKQQYQFSTVASHPSFHEEEILESAEKIELLEIIKNIQVQSANLSKEYERAKTLVEALPSELLNDVLVAIASNAVSEVHSKVYIARAHNYLLQLAQKIVQKGGNIHYRNDEILKRAARNFPAFFEYLLKRSDKFKQPYCLATFKTIAEQNPNFAYSHILTIYIQQLSMPQSRETIQEHVEFLAVQLVDKDSITPEFIQQIIQRIHTDKPIGTELIADDIIAAILQERDTAANCKK